ncbi:hypothetical protein BgAZ_502030 [Babesia gibsoni]|uniref:Uncharacterized protein n=1 Tax=Babesia gibsoni TaxID=33632 RepID=A0AAD8PDA3_BABGI|nr:hypothetical protein BgAZ_502030 [Babesia gibsoni]
MESAPSASVPSDDVKSDVGGKVVLDTDVYCSLVKCAFSRAMDNQYGTQDRNQLFKHLLNSLSKVPVDIPDQDPPKPDVGELRGNLKYSIDSIKSDFLDHYALLYNLEEYSIRERLEILGKHTPLEESVTRESKAPATIARGPSGQKEEEVVTAEKPVLKDEEQQQQQETSAPSGLFSMIDSLKNKFEKLNHRIESLDNEIGEQVCDPSLREWEHSRESLHMRGQYDIEGDEDLGEHIRNLYSHLHHQAKLNEQKIDAMRNRLTTLQAHAKIIGSRQKHDTRVAF